jgi:hypothetical protein
MVDAFYDDPNNAFDDLTELSGDTLSSQIFEDLNLGQPFVALSETTDNIESLLNGSNEICWECNQPNFFEALSNQFQIEINGHPISEIPIFDPQDEPYSCAVATTSMIFHSLGYEYGEEYFSQCFEKFGIYDPQTGTLPSSIDEAINKISERNGLEIHASEINNFSLEDLKTHLDAGNKMLIALDAYELYNEDGMTLKEVKNIPDSGHAVQLTGIVESKNGSFAVINDPGISDGAGKSIPMDKFMNACKDFNFTAFSVC